MNQQNKYLILVIFCLLKFAFDIAAQKASIDSSAIRMWSGVEGAAITNDGNYVSFIIKNIPLNSRTVVFQSTNNNWKQEFIGASTSTFTDDSKKAIFRIGKDSLCLLTLGSEKRDFISNIRSYKIPQTGIK